MTRLKRENVDPIPGGLHAYEGHLRRVTGASLRQIACRAVGVEEARMESVLGRTKIAAVPVGSGQGVIPGFSSAVVSIVSHLGFKGYVTDGWDLSGIIEGFERGADILMLADDDGFVALIPATRQVVDNDWATAQGFVAALELMNGGLVGESALVLGCGLLGVAATKALLACGAEVTICDIRRERALATLSALRDAGWDTGDRIRMEDDPRSALESHALIFDATNAGGFMEPVHLTHGPLVAAPGMPCGLTPEAMEVHRDRVLHDALEIGTATMAVQAAALLGSGVKLKEKGEG